MTLIEYFRCCCRAAEGSLPKSVIEAWIPEAFRRDFQRGISPEDAAKIRVIEIFGETVEVVEDIPVGQISSFSAHLVRREFQRVDGASVGPVRHT